MQAPVARPIAQPVGGGGAPRMQAPIATPVQQQPAGAAPLTVRKPDASAGAGGWKVRMTVDGGEYYHNVITDAVSWDKPRELQSAAERETDNSDCVWMSTGEGGWVAAHVLGRTAKGVKARPVGGGKEALIPTGKKDPPIYPLKLSHLADRFMQPDLVLLESLDPPLIAYDLKHRFKKVRPKHDPQPLAEPLPSP